MKRFIPFLSSDPKVAVIRLQGAIAANARGGISDATFAPVIERAFSKGKPAAVALVINSPGGSPVQSALVAARVRRLAKEKDVKVHAFVEDVAASGGYWLACAADDIWVDPSSIVGSIGVVSAGFGFVEALGKLGVERRVHTAGENKSILDPFSPEKAEDIERLKALQTDIHASFIEHVKTHRGTRLKDDPEMFTGAFWTGARGVELGLADGIGHLVPKMKELYGAKVKFAAYEPKKPLIPRFGAQVLADLDQSMEERALYARFGLT
ncbi:multidrug transporter [Jannaschia sp. EhC01]|uniref:S49 family peptidase n=1 Tax=Gymnodinialimonas phycosphaerae TaxID=2841589 RepID=A0A975TRR7_9RHOB|nr:S49 family peptidase [Gymnodinialimonas phycosphaerae]MBY4893792.1 S49 family peptidase [Gymnodinialimonas phycosphaerae]OAN76573.1 multidrug transporter [Jannaschia sp. EhC01]